MERLVRYDDEVDKFLDGAFDSLQKSGQTVPYEKSDCRDAFRELLEGFAIAEPYQGNQRQRANLRSLTAALIGRYVNAIRLNVPTGPEDTFVHIDDDAKMEIFVLKQLTWHYVIDNVALASQQYGQRRIIRELFEIFADAGKSGQLDIFPPSHRELLEQAGNGDKEARLRIVADLLSGMTEQQAVAMHQRLTGVSLGTVMNAIVS